MENFNTLHFFLIMFSLWIYSESKQLCPMKNLNCWPTKATEHESDLSPQAQHAQSMKLIWRPQDLILVLLLLAAMAFTVLRGLVRTKTKNAGKQGINDNLPLTQFNLHFLQYMLMMRECHPVPGDIPTHHIWSLLDTLLFRPPCAGSSGLTTGCLLHLPSGLWALPEGPCRLSSRHGDHCASLLVSARQRLQHLIASHWSVFKQPAEGWSPACCRLNLTALFSLSPADWKVIFHHYTHNECGSDWPPHRSSLLLIDIRLLCERKWSDLLLFFVADLTWSLFS